MTYLGALSSLAILDWRQIAYSLIEEPIGTDMSRSVLPITVSVLVFGNHVVFKRSEDQHSQRKIRQLGAQKKIPFSTYLVDTLRGKCCKAGGHSTILIEAIEQIEQQLRNIDGNSFAGVLGPPVLIEVFLKFRLFGNSASLFQLLVGMEVKELSR